MTNNHNDPNQHQTCIMCKVNQNLTGCFSQVIDIDYVIIFIEIDLNTLDIDLKNIIKCII